MSYPISAMNPFRETAWYIPWGQIWDVMFELQLQWRSGNRYSHDFENVYVECAIGDTLKWIEVGKALYLATLSASEMQGAIDHAIGNHFTVIQLGSQLDEQLRLGFERTPNRDICEPQNAKAPER